MAYGGGRAQRDAQRPAGIGRNGVVRPPTRSAVDHGPKERAGPVLAEAVELLGDQVDQLGADTTELQERLDFAERMLTAPPETAAPPTPT